MSHTRLDAGFVFISVSLSLFLVACDLREPTDLDATDSSVEKARDQDTEGATAESAASRPMKSASPSVAPVLLSEEEQAAADWASAHSFAFDSSDPELSLDDLAPLREIIGDARIVALGEGTHGSREFFQMKHRLVEFLAREMGFTVFSIEANMPEAYSVGDWVDGEVGSASEKIGGMYFWTWNTEEVLELVEWMREFNASGDRSLAFTGFDMQFDRVARQIVSDFVSEHVPDFVDELAEAYETVAAAEREPRYGFATAGGTFPHELAAGRTIRFSGYIRTQDLEDGWAALWWRADGPDQETLAFDNMEERGPRGTTEWTEYAIEMAVPEEAANISFGMLMSGRGRAYFDSLSLEIDGEPYADPDRFDFDFESRDIVGFHAPETREFEINTTRGTANTGDRSLRIASKVQAEVDEDAVPMEEGRQAAERVLRALESRRDALLTVASARSVDWAIQNARVVEQSLRSESPDDPNPRDLAMADNISWILDQDPEARVVLWAHNLHVSRSADWMGTHLAERYGDDYLPVGFATYRGRYYAMGGHNADHVHDLQRPESGSVEQVLRAMGSSHLILDLRAAEDGDAGAWFTEPRQMRSLGAMAQDSQFYPIDPASSYDLLIYIEDTEEARQLPSIPASTHP